MLHAALEAEIEAHLARYQDRKDEAGKHLVVRNVYENCQDAILYASPSILTPCLARKERYTVILVS